MLVIDKPAGIPVHSGPGGGPHLEHWFPLLRFGLPTVPADASVYALNLVDRYYLFHKYGAATAGVYSIAVKLAGRDLTGQVVVEGVEVFLGLGNGDAELEAGEGDVVAVVAVEAEVVEVDREWGEDFVVGELTGEGNGCELVGFGKVEIFRQDANDLIGCSGDLNGSADDVGVGIVERLPEMPGEDGDFFLAWSCFFGEEVAAEGGLGAEDVEEIGEGKDATDETRVIAGDADAGGSLLEDGEVFEGGGVLSPVVEVAGIGAGVGEELFEETDFFPNDDDAAAVAVGEGFEENSIDYAEEGGGGSDAEGQGEDRGEGEAWGLAELAESVA